MPNNRRNQGGNPIARKRAQQQSRLTAKNPNGNRNGYQPSVYRQGGNSYVAIMGLSSK